MKMIQKIVMTACLLVQLSNVFASQDDQAAWENAAVVFSLKSPADLKAGSLNAGAAKAKAGVSPHAQAIGLYMSAGNAARNRNQFPLAGGLDPVLGVQLAFSSSSTSTMSSTSTSAPAPTPTPIAPAPTPTPIAPAPTPTPIAPAPTPAGYTKDQLNAAYAKGVADTQNKAQSQLQAAQSDTAAARNQATQLLAQLQAALTDNTKLQSDLQTAQAAASHAVAVPDGLNLPTEGDAKTMYEYVIDAIFAKLDIAVAAIADPTVKADINKKIEDDAKALHGKHSVAKVKYQDRSLGRLGSAKKKAVKHSKAR